MELTNSQFSSFLNCPRRYRYEYVDCRVPNIEAEPLIFGSMVHVGLEKFWSGENIESAQEAIKSFADESESADKEILWMKADAMICAYYDFYSKTQDEWEMVNVEQVYETSISDDLSHKMKADAIARKKSDGSLYLIEHKTTSLNIAVDVGEADYWLKLYIDTQITGYQVALEKQFNEPVSILYDVCKKHGSKKPKLKAGIRKRKDESDEDYELRKLENTETLQDFRDRLYHDMTLNPDDYFSRRVIARTDQDREQWKEEFLAVADDIERAKDRAIFPKNSEACFKYGKCPYFNVCSGVDDLAGENFRDKNSINEELQEQEGEHNGRIPF